VSAEVSAVVIRKVSLNGMAGRADVIRPWIQALNNRELVLEKAGFIFKAGLADGGHFMLAVEPCLIQGARRYHYNMHLPTRRLRRWSAMWMLKECSRLPSKPPRLSWETMKNRGT